MASIFTPQAEAKGLKLIISFVSELDLSDDQFILLQPQLSRRASMPFGLVGDERRLKQLLINLVKNSLKFTDEGIIEVKVAYRKDESLLVVHVRDTGCGIAPNDMDKLFSRFGKLQRTAEINSEGIGLGLMICQQIVRQSGGTILVLSDGIDLGSTFKFSMPAPRAEHEFDNIAELPASTRSQ